LQDLIKKPLYKDAKIDRDWLAHVTETTKSMENGSDLESEGTDDEDTNIKPINPSTWFWYTGISIPNSDCVFRGRFTLVRMASCAGWLE